MNFLFGRLGSIFKQYILKQIKPIKNLVVLSLFSLRALSLPEKKLFSNEFVKANVFLMSWHAASKKFSINKTYFLNCYNHCRLVHWNNVRDSRSSAT